MDELEKILLKIPPKESEPIEKKSDEITTMAPKEGNRPYLPDPKTSEIPDLIFDVILVTYKISRLDILIFLFLYRHVWCRPNLYMKFGIGEILSLQSVASKLDINMNDLFAGLEKLEQLKFIETIRSGQYFIRKYVFEDLDLQYGQTYDNF